MNLNIVTKEDLIELKQEFLDEIKELKQSGNSRDKKYLRSAEIRKMFNISAGTLQNMRINGTLPYSKVGTTILYDLDKVIEILNENSYN
jgi:hypothetical protein